jgi:protein-tyrosine phosphatase
VIDLHCHVLPAIDDGPASHEEAIALVVAARAAGAERLVATPHVSWRYHNDSSTIAAALAELTGRLGADAGVRIQPGAEIAFTLLGELVPEELGRLGLGGGRWLLLEPPSSPIAPGLAEAVADLHSRGHGVVIAHPERCQVFHRNPALLQSLVGEGALTSITAGSLVGRFGNTVRRFAMGLFEAGLAHNVTSDFHSTQRRPPGTQSELQQAGFAALADWLTHDVPAAILDGHDVPPRPSHTPPAPSAKRQGRWHRWRARPPREPDAAGGHDTPATASTGGSTR